jgi:hypothetical protein
VYELCTENKAHSEFYWQQMSNAIVIEYGQFNLTDRLSSPSAPQKLASPNFFYFVKITSSRSFRFPTPDICISNFISSLKRQEHVRSITWHPFYW